MIMSLVTRAEEECLQIIDEMSIKTSQPGLTQANGSRSLMWPLGRHGRSPKVDLRVDGTTSVVTSHAWSCSKYCSTVDGE